MWLHRCAWLNSFGFKSDRDVKKELWGRGRRISGVPVSCRKIKRDPERRGPIQRKITGDSK